MAQEKKDFIKDVCGKVVERISVSVKADWQEVEVRFQDKTAFSLVLNVRLEIEGAELLDWSTGDSKVLRKLL